MLCGLGASTFLSIIRGVSRWWGQAVLSGGLRLAVKCLYELCPQVFYARRNRRNSPSMARFLLASASMPRHFCALQHNSTDTKQLRYSPARQHRLPPPPTYVTYAEIQCAGPHLRFGRHGAHSLYVGSSHPTTLPTHIIALRSFANVFFSIRDMATWLRPSTSATCFCVLSCI